MIDAKTEALIFGPRSTNHTAQTLGAIMDYVLGRWGETLSCVPRVVDRASAFPYETVWLSAAPAPSPNLNVHIEGVIVVHAAEDGLWIYSELLLYVQGERQSVRGSPDRNYLYTSYERGTDGVGQWSPLAWKLDANGEWMGYVRPGFERESR